MTARTGYRRGVARGALLLLALAGCGTEPVGPANDSIAGWYILVDLSPSSPIADSTGGTVSVLSGQLLLGRAPSEPYVYTPGGVIARSCTYEIPDGAWVDPAHVVHRPDGSTYALPRCGTGSYTLLLNVEHVAADGSSRIVADSSVGLYTWGRETSAGGIVTLVDAGMDGSVTFGAGGPVIRIAAQHLFYPLAPAAPFPSFAYVFSRPMPD